MNMIVAADKNWAIGKDNSLLVVIPADQKTFRNMTLGHPVVMGRKTFESLPGGLPLDLRKNIVLTTNPEFHPKGVTVVHSLKELFEELGEEKDELSSWEARAFTSSFFPIANVVHVTRIDQAYEADTYFPDLDQKPEWKITAESDEQTYFDLEYTFVRYERKKS